MTISQEGIIQLDVKNIKLSLWQLWSLIMSVCISNF